MPCVRDILARKGSKVFTVSAESSVLEAIQLMIQHGIGALVVASGPRIVGIFTERDVLRRVVGREVAPASATVREVMTEDVVCVNPDTDIDDASRILRDHRIRHLPVVGEDGGLAGMVSIGDINACHASDQETTIHFLHEYIFGRV
jgi:CBS domain-containing protein